ncbi:MAG: AEC family transporter [Acidobacteria bacterium]|nr:AEC family transporter [Acidobacteriota bacterium]
MHIINTLTPIIVLVGLGAILRLAGFYENAFCRELNRLVYWVGVPCLLFSKTAQSTVPLDTAIRLFLCMSLVMVLGILLGYAGGWTLRLPGPSLGAFVQGAFRSNLVYVGLPVILFALATPGHPPEADIASLAVLSVAPLIPLYNVVAVIILLLGQPRDSTSWSRYLRRMFISVVSNPLLIACVAGLAYLLTGWTLPPVVERSCSLIGQMALPLALLSTGASLSFSSLRGSMPATVVAAILKIGVTPMLGFLLAPWFGLTGRELVIVLIYLACPTAVVSFVMAEQLKADHLLTGNIILVTTILSMPGLALILLLASG